MLKENSNFYTRMTSRCTPDECASASRYFYQLLDNNSAQLSKTHYFNDRYENIYLTENNNVTLNCILNDAHQKASSILNMASNNVSFQYWFNDMPPGHITDWHRHDDLNERLSAVFYLLVPEQSGDLVFEIDNKHIHIKPVINDFLFFAPDINHCVEENRSSQNRLSIGFNFGFIEHEDNL